MNKVLALAALYLFYGISAEACTVTGSGWKANDIDVDRARIDITKTSIYFQWSAHDSPLDIRDIKFSDSCILTEYPRNNEESPQYIGHVFFSNASGDRRPAFELSHSGIEIFEYLYRRYNLIHFKNDTPFKAKIFADREEEGIIPIRLTATDDVTFIELAEGNMKEISEPQPGGFSSYHENFRKLDKLKRYPTSVPLTEDIAATAEVALRKSKELHSGDYFELDAPSSVAKIGVALIIETDWGTKTIFVPPDEAAVKKKQDEDRIEALKSAERERYCRDLSKIFMTIIGNKQRSHEEFIRDARVPRDCADIEKVVFEYRKSLMKNSSTDFCQMSKVIEAVEDVLKRKGLSIGSLMQINQVSRTDGTITCKALINGGYYRVTLTNVSADSTRFSVEIGPI